MKSRILTCGDIHGNYDALVQVLERSKFNNSIDQLIMLGDYTDRHSDSAKVVQLLIELQVESDNRHIYIRGNHDVWCGEWLETGVRNKIWTQQGGSATIDSYMSTMLFTEESHKKFFRSLHNYYVDDQNRGFVHGGFKSRQGLGHEMYQADYYWDRDLWNLSLTSDTLYQKGTLHKEGVPQGYRMLKHKEIFIGHTNTTAWNYKHNGVLRITDNTNPDCKVGKPITTPIQACNVWNMDTGGGYNGKVTIMDINTKEYYQSDYYE